MIVRQEFLALLKSSIDEPKRGIQPIEPYEETLTTATVKQRREWAQIVYDQLTANDLLKPDTTLVIHAGKAYYEPLLPLLETDPVTIEIPTEGLQIGDTLAWYNNQ